LIADQLHSGSGKIIRQECPKMPELSRRDFLKLSAGAISGTLVSELANLGMDVDPVGILPKQQQVKQGKEVPSVCPYCAVGCGQIVTVSDGQIVDIQGNYDSPISLGTLCPKGAASFQLAVNPNRWTTAKYRAPYSDHWEEIDLETAMNRIAEKVKRTRDENFIEKVKVEELPDAVVKEKTVNQVLAIASLGGATIDDEWNYLHQKLLRSLGLVSIENQARI
jgi:formate dehydrogenase major subunit